MDWLTAGRRRHLFIVDESGRRHFSVSSSATFPSPHPRGPIQRLGKPYDGPAGKCLLRRAEHRADCRAEHCSDRAQMFAHRLMHTGEPTGGRTLKMMADVARSRFVHLTDDEVTALHRYLQTLSGT